MNDIANFLYAIGTWLVPLTIAIVFHEVAHGLMARACGDQTAESMGRLSFNPLRHVDPFGTVILPMILALSHAPIFGWAKPVPVVAARMRNPRWNMVAVALAGPGMNLLLTIVTTLAMAGLIIIVPDPQGGLAGLLMENFRNLIVINVMLAIFNLLPIPPFDGSHVVQGVLPRPLAAIYGRFQRFGLLIPILLLIVLPMVAPNLHLLDRMIGPPVDWVLGLVDAALNQMVGGVTV